MRNDVVIIGLVLLVLVTCCGYGVAAESEKKADAPQIRIINIKTDITETSIVNGKAQKGRMPITNSLSMAAVEGQSSSVGIYSVIPSGVGAPDGAKADSRGARIDTAVTWLPTICEDGNISLSGKVNFSREGYKPQEMKLSAVLKPGVAQKLPVTAVAPAEKGDKKLELTITVTASIQGAQEDKKAEAGE